MNRNIEIKARSRDWDGQLERAKALSPSFEELVQEDAFFSVSSGRLKLRRLASGPAELIYYERPDEEGPKTSFYERAAAAEPEALHRLLSLALGETARIRKRRLVFRAGATRIHFDDVEGLGRFIELEVVLAPGQGEADGARTARGLMVKLGIAEEDLVKGAYADQPGPEVRAA